MTVKLRPMMAADLPQVAQIECASFGQPWSRELLGQELKEKSSWHLVAIDGTDQVVGYVIGRKYPDVWHVLDLAVAESSRGHGVGGKLLARFLQEADREDMSVVLEVRRSNVAAIRLYSAHGFESIGIRPHYYGYGEHGEDALVMERKPHKTSAEGEREGPLLAIESSCDDTAAAVLTSAGQVLANVVHSQDEIHERYGGVVPEVASRAHVERLTPVVAEALCQAGCDIADLGAVAVTVGPGLIGALLVGVSTAKAIAWTRRIPVIPVNHLHGHLGAVWLADKVAPFPMVVLIASGGHTMLVRADDRRTFTLLGQTLDDAAGEAFDKGARLLGLGYPGGRELDELAEKGDEKAFSFPIGLQRSSRLDFSFSGVKTALYYLLRDMDEDERKARAADVAASYRAAIVAALVTKTLRAAKEAGVRTVAMAGGVAANSLLRRRFLAEAPAAGFHVVVPPLAYCTDNAAMIGAAALAAPALQYPHYLALDASASLSL